MKKPMVCIWLIYACLSCLGLSNRAYAQPLPIEDALRLAQNVAPQTESAAQRLLAARAALAQAGRLRNPELELREENVRFHGSPAGSSSPSLDFFATLSQTIELGGKRAQRQAVANADIAAAEAHRMQVEREIVLLTARYYLGALRAQEEFQALHEARAQFQVLVDTMEHRARDGYAPEADLMKFRGEAARLDLLLSQLRLERDRHATALATLLGEPPPIEGSRLRVPAPLPPPMGERQALVERALQRHPDLRAAEARVERAQHSLALERAQRVPDPALTAGYKRTDSADTLVTGVTVPLPIFDQNRDNVTRAGAEARAALFDRDALRRQLTAELDSLFRAAQELAERARTVETDLLRPAEIVRNATRSSFREGATNILQLVDAERVYADAQRDTITLIVDAYAAALAARLAYMEEPLP